MSNESDHRLHAIEAYDFSFLKEKFQTSFPCDEEEFREIVAEFKNFMKLVYLQDQPLAMIGKGVDEFWHTFLIFTPQYAEFCDNIFGEFIHHQPHTALTPVPEKALTNFFSAYTKEFGEPTPAWTNGYPPEIISSLRAGAIPEGFLYAWSGWTGRSKSRQE